MQSSVPYYSSRYQHHAFPELPSTNQENDTTSNTHGNQQLENSKHQLNQNTNSNKWTDEDRHGCRFPRAHTCTGTCTHKHRHVHSHARARTNAQTQARGHTHAHTALHPHATVTPTTRDPRRGSAGGHRRLHGVSQPPTWGAATSPAPPPARRSWAGPTAGPAGGTRPRCHWRPPSPAPARRSRTARP